jgi:hypothetical protein
LYLPSLISFHLCFPLLGYGLDDQRIVVRNPALQKYFLSVQPASGWLWLPLAGWGLPLTLAIFGWPMSASGWLWL